MNREHKRKGNFFLESNGPKVEEVVHAKSEGCRGTAVREGGTWTVAYTNVDGLVSVMDEVNEFIKANEPDIMALVETKLRDDKCVETSQK